MNLERAFKGKIAGVQVVHRMTKAMEMIAASRLRQQQKQRRASRPYAEAIQAMLSSPWPDLRHWSCFQRYFSPPSGKGKEALVVLSGSQGFCGGLNLRLFEQVEQWMSRRQEERRSVALILLGQKAIQYFEGSPWASLIRMSFPLEGGRPPSFKAIMEWSHYLDQSFLDGTFEAVSVALNRYHSAIQHTPEILPFLPWPPFMASPSPSREGVEFFDEGDPKEILGAIIPRAIESQLHQLCLEHAAGENAARMMAMQGACENAKTMVRDLTLAAQRARQKSITQGVIEINSGAQVLTEG